MMQLEVDKREEHLASSTDIHHFTKGYVTKLYTGITSAILSKLWKPKKIVISVEWEWAVCNQ